LRTSLGACRQPCQARFGVVPKTSARFEHLFHPRWFELGVFF